MSEVVHPRWCCNRSPKDTDIQVPGERIPEEGGHRRPATEASFLVPDPYLTLTTCGNVKPIPDAKEVVPPLARDQLGEQGPETFSLIQLALRARL